MVCARISKYYSEQKFASSLLRLLELNVYLVSSSLQTSNDTQNSIVIGGHLVKLGRYEWYLCIAKVSP